MHLFADGHNLIGSAFDFNKRFLCLLVKLAALLDVFNQTSSK
jgi:hypothetical protein